MEALMAKEFKQQAEEAVKIAGQNIEISRRALKMASDLTEITEHWKGLAYRLNPEIAMEMEKIIREKYQKKEGPKKKAGEWNI